MASSLYHKKSLLHPHDWLGVELIRLVETICSFSVELIGNNQNISSSTRCQDGDDFVMIGLFDYDGCYEDDDDCEQCSKSFPNICTKLSNSCKKLSKHLPNKFQLDDLCYSYLYFCVDHPR